MRGRPKGFKHSKITKEKMHKKALGRKVTNDTINKIKRTILKKFPIGSIRLGNYGYYLIKVNNTDWVHKHRIIVEKYIGRKLKRKEIIHHIDANRQNNKLSNLYIFDNTGLHIYFEILVKYKIIDRFILKSNLKEYKNGR